MNNQETTQDRSPALQHINRGVILHINGDPEGAREHYERALDYEPENATALNNLGYVLAQQGAIEDAMRCY